MRSLLAKIPTPDKTSDRWCGTQLPPVYETVAAKAGDAWFVDGGNAAILEAPHFSFQQLRAVGVHYPTKRVIVLEAQALLLRTKDGWTMHLGDESETFFPVEEGQDAVSRARQHLEHIVALQALAEHDGIVILDGDVAPDGCFALQKTISVLTENGFPLSTVLDRQGPWAAPLGPKIVAAKLHARARHVFLIHGLESLSLQKDRDAALATLAFYSGDALFPGYPGGLVLADRLARVSKEEAQALRVKARSQLRELRGRVDAAEASVDSHGILDTM